MEGVGVFSFWSSHPFETSSSFCFFSATGVSKLSAKNILLDSTSKVVMNDKEMGKKKFSRVSNVVLNDFGAVFSKNDRWCYKISFPSHAMYNLNRLYNAMWVTHFFTAYDLMTALKRLKTFRFQRRLRPK